MKVWSSVSISRDPDLQEKDWKRAGALRREITSEWNAGHQPKIDEVGLVTLEHGSRVYEELRRFFLSRAKDVPPELLGWSEKLEAVYSRQELEEFEILRLWINGTTGSGGNTYAQVYDLSVCQACGLIAVQRQVRDIVVDLTKASKDFAQTDNFYETLVSDRLQDLLQKAQVTGLKFRSVEHARPSRRPKRRYAQLLVHNVIRPLLAPRYNWTKHCQVCGRGLDAEYPYVDKPDIWTEIWKVGPGPWKEPHFPRASYQGWDLMRTEAEFWGPMSPDNPKPKFYDLIISERLYRLLREHKITGYWVEPAHLDEVAQPSLTHAAT